MKYRIINNKGYNIYIERFELLPGENVLECSQLEADILASSNGLIVEAVKPAQNKGAKLLDKQNGASNSI